MNKFFAFILLAVFVSCNQKQGQHEEPAVIDTAIYDAKFSESFIGRIEDKWFDVIILGDGYKGRGGLDLFLFDANLGRKTLLEGFTKFDTANYIDTSKVRFHFRNVKQNLGCDDNTGLNEGVSCSVDKIKSVAKDMTNNFSLFTPDHIAVFMNGKVHGGSDGALISVEGFGEHITVPSVCPDGGRLTGFYRGAMGKLEHEFWHTYICMCHIEVPSNKLSGCVNGCCYILNSPLLLQHQVIFANKFNLITQ